MIDHSVLDLKVSDIMDKGIVLWEIIIKIITPPLVIDCCLFYCHSKISVVQSNRICDLKNSYLCVYDLCVY